ncbi:MULTISPECIES: carboxymuconolactone decarboxylase family protein [Flavobacterium]|jgi:AhpD family alkylhydroperoxidase|uniref:carboxymuconolactone decarboxylase family protein n=1 Tax=Flavobacterium TaxID=237 RepID=UPI000AEB1A7C|nr:carboxymuconolactone decarboxylase family protein [Flavobacterium johnsoniae]MBX9808738.1 carboxymuconolactone decarboxylase family protein [Flavobacteriaceae bacterium]TXI90627.1 MAG: carboxymuconolactone decarboxylase family protein [Chryseobacterium sp.]
MENIEFTNLNFDPEGSDFLSIASEMAKAYGYTANLSVEKELAQLIRLRIATLNKCSYCSILHYDATRKLGISPAKIDNLGSYWHSNLYTNKEKAALEYTDILNKGVAPNFETYHQKMAQHFSIQEIQEIAYIVINMNLWTRLKLAQGQIPNYK